MIRFDKACVLSREVLVSVGVPEEMIDLNIAYAYICKAEAAGESWGE